ncbi:hypothetical protein DFH06DRAFT_1309613 [Mycena polygramma]|nr:hypothetical protein DFH06DRAFT_1309613 [Mycena polygramma]
MPPILSATTRDDYTDSILHPRRWPPRTESISIGAGSHVSYRAIAVRMDWRLASCGWGWEWNGGMARDEYGGCSSSFPTPAPLPRRRDEDTAVRATPIPGCASAFRTLSIMLESPSRLKARAVSRPAVPSIILKIQPLESAWPPPPCPASRGSTTRNPTQLQAPQARAVSRVFASRGSARKPARPTLKFREPTLHPAPPCPDEARRITPHPRERGVVVSRDAVRWRYPVRVRSGWGMPWPCASRKRIVCGAHTAGAAARRRCACKSSLGGVLLVRGSVAGAGEGGLRMSRGSLWAPGSGYDTAGKRMGRAINGDDEASLEAAGTSP